MASIDVWIEGEWGKQQITWHVDDVAFDLDRFHYDQRYAELIDKHVKDALSYLGEELSIIAVMVPPEESPDYDWTHCE